MSLIDDDVENIRAALRFLSGSPPPDDRFDRLAFALHKWWYVHGEIEEGRRALDEALARRAGRTERFDGRLLAASGNLEWGAGRLAEARDRYERSLAVWHRLGEHTQAAAMHSNIAIVCHRLGDSESALREHEHALSAYERAGDTRGLAFAKLNYSAGLIDDGRLDDAARLLLEVLPVLLELDDRFRIGVAYANLGRLERLRRNFAKAEEWLRRALACRAAINDRAGALRAVHELGLCRASSGQFTSAVALLAHAVSRARDCGTVFETRDERERESLLGGARSALRESEFGCAWQAGSAATSWESLVAQKEQDWPPTTGCKSA
jgi:tetratricopeptide (TPR) repeat protein